MKKELKKVQLGDKVYDPITLNAFVEEITENGISIRSTERQMMGRYILLYVAERHMAELGLKL